MQLELLCKCWQTATCETSPNNPSSEHCYVLLRGSQSAAKVVDVHLKCHSPSIFGHVLCTQVWELLLGKCAVNGGGGVAESENCYFNSVHFSSSLFSLPPSPFRAQSKKVTTQRNPNQDRKCGLICCMLVPRCGARDCSPQAHAQLQLQSRHEKAPGEQKKNPHEATQHACDYFWSSRCSAQPSASSQVTTRGLNNQTRAALVPLKIPW